MQEAHTAAQAIARDESIHPSIRISYEHARAASETEAEEAKERQLRRMHQTVDDEVTKEHLHQRLRGCDVAHLLAREASRPQTAHTKICNDTYAANSHEITNDKAQLRQQLRSSSSVLSTRFPVSPTPDLSSIPPISSEQ